MNKTKKSSISSTFHVDEVLFHNPSCLSAQYPHALLILTPITSIPALFTSKKLVQQISFKGSFKTNKQKNWGGEWDGVNMKNSPGANCNHIPDLSFQEKQQ